ncbi:hypothetical protein WA026_006639 [Henosepilachna vigintioctopunctata]
MKGLTVFDFDHTIIQENSDTAVADLIKGGIPSHVKKLHKKDGWTAFMQGVFDILHHNEVNKNDISDVITKLKPVEGMTNLINDISTHFNYDVIIISDSNMYFINIWLENNGLKEYVLKVFSNPAVFSDGALKIQMYHIQDYCDFSTKNLCKGQILTDFLEMQKTNNIVYDKVMYIGDGSNDFCPILKLTDCDYAFVRHGYKCIDLVNKAKKGEIHDRFGISQSVKANVFVWKTGYDILKYMHQIENQQSQ